MLQKGLTWLLGQAPEGSRKLLFGTLALLLVWVFMMWAPNLAHTEATMIQLRVKALDVMWWIVAAVIAGNIGEHSSKALAQVAALRSGKQPTSPPAAPGA